MFWRFGGYANISTIDTILDKPDFHLEDLLDESDLIQELKQHNTKLIEYLREPAVLQKLLDYVVAPKLEPVEVPGPGPDSPHDPASDESGAGKNYNTASSTRPRASSRATDGDEDDEDEDDAAAAPNAHEEAEKKRNKYAYVAAEVLSSDNWSIYEALMESQALLRGFWDFLHQPAPLDPLQASYFTKVNESLFDKKTDSMLPLFKSLDAAVPDMLRHVDCPMIMDLLLKIISLERSENGQGVVEWLYTKDVMPTLLSFLSPEHNWATQTSAGDFIKAIITVSANASQNEQACIGPNELTRQLVSRPCVEQLIGYMLQGGNPLTVGVGIIIEVIRKNNSDYDPDVGPDSNALPSSRDPIYLGTLLRLFAQHVPDFMTMILKPKQDKPRLSSTFGNKIEPLGFDRFKTCELMAELLHCSNMALLNEVGSEQLIAERDAQRQKLRAEGRLSATRGEEAQSSAEDLTMRGRHSSPDDGRRLEVTNASDDDGFEEVNPSGEMTEDTSHEFVKAEDEIPISSGSGPTASFLDKDGGDFVDEPLSSPRLPEQDIPPPQQHFENPELVVAPLSPKKKAAAPVEPGSPTAEPVLDPEASSSSSSAPADQQKPSGEKPASVEAEAASGEVAGEALRKESTTPTAPAGSATAAEGSADKPQDATSDVQTAKTNDAAGEAAAATAAEAEAQGEQSAEPSAQQDPVVGDYLKMQFVEHQVVPTILSFFFKYPWNNFLHNVVYDIVQQVFNGPMDRGFNSYLAISLFEAADITNAIINGQGASEKSQAENKTRMGYMGHLTLIAEEVVKFTERNPPELLSSLVMERVMSQEWINYVEGALAETRERDNAILGGVRPEVAMSNRAMAGNSLGGMGLSSVGLSGGQGGSSALADAGLNAGGGGAMETQDNGSGSSLGPFSISSGLLSGSGFGSSSDEDEDEVEENDEDVNNEFRAYTDPLNASGTSMDPPSIPPPPPPPPPLNIPPSRARLQLAARLAMHQKSTSQADGDNDEDAADMTHEPESMLKNPFDDDGEDEVDDDSDDGLGGEGGDAWNDGVRGSWWRDALRRGKEKFGDGRDDSDSDKEDGGDAEDEEFGDFAMPDEEKESGGDKPGVIVKPLPVHPPAQNQKTSAFTSLWPFGSKDKEKKSEETGSSEPHEMRGDDGEKISSTHEAERRTSIEEPDDEEVVV